MAIPKSTALALWDLRDTLKGISALAGLLHGTPLERVDRTGGLVLLETSTEYPTFDAELRDEVLAGLGAAAALLTGKAAGEVDVAAVLRLLQLRAYCAALRLEQLELDIRREAA